MSSGAVEETSTRLCSLTLRTVDKGDCAKKPDRIGVSTSGNATDPSGRWLKKFKGRN